MIDIVPYTPCFGEALRAMDPGMFSEVTELKDVLSETVYIALSDGVFAGVGYLTAAPSFLSIDRKLAYYHLHLNFKAVPGSDAEIEASGALISKLSDETDAIQTRFPCKRIILRAFLEASETALLEFYYAFGFHAARTMLRMVCPLSGIRTKRLPEGFKMAELPVEEPDVMAAYLRVNGAAFEVPDSASELLFNIKYKGAKVYGLIDATIPSEAKALSGRLTAAVTTWPVGGGRIATENIVVDPAYQHRGLMTALLSKILKKAEKAGCQEASLSLFADNLPAFGLYEKLGYEPDSVILTLEYEKDYQSMPY